MAGQLSGQALLDLRRTAAALCERLQGGAKATATASSPPTTAPAAAAAALARVGLQGLLQGVAVSPDGQVLAGLRLVLELSVPPASASSAGGIAALANKVLKRKPAARRRQSKKNQRIPPSAALPLLPVAVGEAAPAAHGL